ncbi:cupin domain-containing protein [Anaerovorax odorimutans]|uniref:Cupin domain-containing protein n=1 Tax=Anaerovorax odorimutans TaxID=109327 RepID=A0ABT1RSM8_9FIRM|nr:cupin domain-containing protein [Anaerovorax odorimutans]MCQ4638146.1 cupin domain-containing protein [Anaerovorax odorimutans]
MNTERIIIDTKDSRHALSAISGREESAHSFVQNVHISGNNEMNDYIAYQGTKIPLHTHDKGYELFYVQEGELTAVLGGYRAKVRPGDMLLIPPAMPHGFEYGQQTVWWEVMNGMFLWDRVWSLDRIFENCPEKYEDQTFREQYEKRKGQVSYPEFPIEGVTEVNAEKLPGFSGRGMCYKTYSFSGIQCRLKYPKWELAGKKEIWEFELDEQMSVDFGHYVGHELFAVTQGSVRVEVQGREPMTARKGELINIPNFTSHKLTALEAKTTLLDFNVQYNLMLLLDEIVFTKKKNPQRIDPVFLEELLDKHQCPYRAITGIFTR